MKNIFIFNFDLVRPPFSLLGNFGCQCDACWCIGDSSVWWRFPVFFTIVIIIVIILQKEQNKCKKEFLTFLLIKKPNILPGWPLASLVNNRFISWLYNGKTAVEILASPILRKYRTSHTAFWLATISYRPFHLSCSCNKATLNFFCKFGEFVYHFFNKIHV